MFFGNRDVVSIIKDGLEKMLDFFLLAYKKMTAAARHSIIQVAKISAKPFNPIIPGVQKPYSARGGASEAPRVKSQHSGLPDDPMPYNGNYILCLGIN